MAHQLAEGVIDQPVTGDRRFARKGARYDEQTVMAATAFGAFVPGMQRRVVDQLDTAWGKRRQTLVQQFLKIAGGIEGGGRC